MKYMSQTNTKSQSISQHQNTTYIDNFLQNISSNNSPSRDQLKSMKKSYHMQFQRLTKDQSLTPKQQSYQKLSNILGIIAGDGKIISQTNKNTLKFQKTQFYDSSSNNVSVKPTRKNSNNAYEILHHAQEVENAANYTQLFNLPQSVTSLQQSILMQGDSTLKLRKNNSMQDIQRPLHFLENANTPNPSPGVHKSILSGINTTALINSNSQIGFKPYIQIKQKRGSNPNNVIPNQAQIPCRGQFKKNTSIISKISNITLEPTSEKLKSRLRNMLLDLKNHTDETRERAYLVSFNHLLHSICTNIITESRSKKEDTAPIVQLEHLFQRQVRIVQGFYTLGNEKNTLEQRVNQLQQNHEEKLLKIQADHENIMKISNSEKDKINQSLQLLMNENQRLTNEVSKLEKANQELIAERQFKQEKNNKLLLQISSRKNSPVEEKTQQQLKSAKISIDQKQINQEQNQKEELEYLVQGQFEAIQKLLQREQLTKLFFKRIGDNQIVKLFEDFINNAEELDQSQTEGNLNVQFNQDQEKDQHNLNVQQHYTRKESLMSNLVLAKYEQSYKQLNQEESALADDSYVNDSDESSFGFLGKDNATQISSCLDNGQNLQKILQALSKKQNKIPQEQKKKLQLNMRQVYYVNEQKDKEKALNAKNNAMEDRSEIEMVNKQLEKMKLNDISSSISQNCSKQKPLHIQTK